MPTYEYACTSCGHRLEVVQSFSDPALTTCPVCRAPLRKVFGNVGIVLKGSGFYKTDSRSAKSNGSGAKSKESKESKEKESSSSSTEAAASTSTAPATDTGSKKDSSPTTSSSGSGSSEKAASPSS